MKEYIKSQIKVDLESNYAEKTEEELRKLIEEAYKDDLLNRFLYDSKWEQGYQDGMIDGYKKRDAEITRCKDCVHCSTDMYCWGTHRFVKDNYFCDNGERREDG